MPSATIRGGVTADSDETATSCIRCKAHPAAHDLRSENVCTSCFVQYIQNKTIKRLELLQRETRALRSPRLLPACPQRYLLALSGGPSSACLLDVLYDNILQQRAKGQRAKFELLVMHVVDDDVDIDVNAGPAGDSAETGQKAEESGIAETTTVCRFRKQFPEVEIRSVPLSGILQLDTIDWSTLPPADIPGDPATSHTASSETALREQQPLGNDGNPQTQRRRLAHLFSQLPSATSRADVRRLLTRHLLITTAAASGCDVLLLGYNTTSLAELALSETAKGRGFALPWMVNDGAIPLPRSISDNTDDRPRAGGGIEGAEEEKKKAGGTMEIPVYSLLRDIYRKELFVYLTSSDTSSSTPLSSSEPPSSESDNTTTAELRPQLPLSSLISPHLLPPHLRDPSSSSPSAAPTAAVVSHRDLSIDDVMARYFADVEANYPSVVANVVRTTGKLARILGGGAEAQKHDQHHHHHPDEEEQHHRHQQPATGTAGESVPVLPEQQRQQKPPSSGRCGICGLRLDEHGNERWRGELGELDATAAAAAAAAATTTISSSAAAPTTLATTITDTAQVASAAAQQQQQQQQQQQHRQRVRASGKLCYGCERSILG